MERTFVMFKPDAIQRALVGELLGRFERRGLRLAGLKLVSVAEPLARKHYAEHEGQPFHAGLIQYITSGPVVVAAVEGPDAVAVVRQTVGATRPAEAAPGTIRADYGLMVGRNLIHASDSSASAARELDLWFQPDELVTYVRDVDKWILEPEALAAP